MRIIYLKIFLPLLLALLLSYRLAVLPADTYRSIVRTVVSAAPLLHIAGSPARSSDENTLTILQPDSGELHVYSTLPDSNTLLTKFSKKPWGTWNIEGWYLANGRSLPARSAQLLMGGGSDWEYVFRVATQPTPGAYTFSGGNHGREKLLDIKYRDAVSNAEILPDKNRSLHIKALKILESTSLYLDENFRNKFADVRRTYTVQPSRITFEAEFTFTSEVYMGTSYMCMLPATKKFGRYIRFNDTGNVYATPPEGQTYTTEKAENYLGREGTLSVRIWGDSYPVYQYRVWIEDRGMVDSFRNRLKVFYWDLNTAGNKLYFSRFDSEAPARIPAGTVWHHKQGWELYTP